MRANGRSVNCGRGRDHPLLRRAVGERVINLKKVRLLAPHHRLDGIEVAGRGGGDPEIPAETLRLPFCAVSPNPGADRRHCGAASNRHGWCGAAVVVFELGREKNPAVQSGGGKQVADEALGAAIGGCRVDQGSATGHQGLQRRPCGAWDRRRPRTPARCPARSPAAFRPNAGSAARSTPTCRFLLPRAVSQAVAPNPAPQHPASEGRQVQEDLPGRSAWIEALRPAMRPKTAPAISPVPLA